MRVCLLQTLVGLALALLTLPPDQVNAQGRSRGGSNAWKFMSEKYDKNNDDKISLAEYTRGEEAFKQLDKNDDGFLTSEDWSGGRRGRDRSAATAPSVGDQAPQFALTEVTDAASTVRLSDFKDKKPVALIFGSCT